MEVKSPAVGKVLRINCEAGAEVAAGDELIVIESMKMEIPVLARGSGRIRQIYVRVGDQVQRNRTLILIDG